jgi:tRNA(fMet)-specific endonuclease VapC
VVARLTLDTGVLIAAERGRLDLSGVVSPDDDVTVPAVVVAEYLAGVYMADTDARRATRRAFLDQVLRALPVEDYTSQVADHHAALLAHVRRLGKPRGAHDLILAASARAYRRTIITTDDRARLGDLPEVAVRAVPAQGRS